MKSILRVFSKFNKKAMASIALACMLSMFTVIFAKAEVVTSGYNGQAMYNEVTSEGWSYPANNIGKIYGEDAKAAYLNAVLTGDYTAFRTLIGDWRPIYKLGVNVKSDGTVIKDAVGTAQQYESKTYAICGKYGTVKDLYAYAAQYGYDLNNTNQMNEFCLNVTLWKTIPYPAQKKSPAAAQPAAKAAPAASNSKVEALKSYKGNTAEFNAYYYYVNYPDLQIAIGADGKALLKHYNEFGKAEGRVASKSIK